MGTSSVSEYPPGKNCSGCGEQKPLTEFHRSNGGYYSLCKTCKNTKTKQHYKENRARLRTHARRRHIENLEYERTLHRAAYYRQASTWGPENRKKNIIRAVQWNQANKQRRREIVKNWALNNREKLNAKDARRYAAEKNACPIWADHAAILWFYHEAQKLTKETGVLHEVDHIVPLRNKRVCGLHVHYNLQILTADQNRRKNNQWSPE